MTCIHDIEIRVLQNVKIISLFSFFFLVLVNEKTRKSGTSDSWQIADIIMQFRMNFKLKYVP